MNDQPVNALYHFSLSPFSRKVRLVLAEKKIEIKLLDEPYWEQGADFLRRNPAGKVPILKLGQRHLTESMAICEYLEETHPTPPLLPRSAEARHEVRRLVGWFDDTFYHGVTKKLLGERVFKKMTGGGYPDSANVKSGSRAVKFHLDYMAQLLEQRRWLAGNEMSLADFAAAAHLSCLDYISDVDWNRSDTVKDWYAKIKSPPGVPGPAGRSGAGIFARSALRGSGLLRLAAGGAVRPASALSCEPVAGRWRASWVHFPLNER